MVYFDHNATSPLCPEARQAWLAAADELIGNPSSPHRLGSRADHALEQARAGLASALACSPQDVSWTSGATESNNAVFFHASRILPSDAEVWISAIEHPCCQAPALRYFPNQVRSVPVDREGVADLDWIRRHSMDRKPGLIAVMAANNETGVLQPWQLLAGLCQSQGILFFCDATQWIGKLPASGLGVCDYLTGSGHKLGGPRGIGFVKWPGDKPKSPLLIGGNQEWGRRAGTENVAGAIAMTAALNAREAVMETPSLLNPVGSKASAAIAERLSWRNAFIETIGDQIAGIQVVGAPREQLWNTVSVVMPETGCRLRWVVKLDKLGFAVSTGSACASGKEEPSSVLKAMGRTDAEASRALRFSSGWETSLKDWLALAEAMQRILKGA
jgi:cysteine desulfurase